MRNRRGKYSSSAWHVCNRFEGLVTKCPFAKAHDLMEDDEEDEKQVPIPVPIPQPIAPAIPDIWPWIFEDEKDFQEDVDKRPREFPKEAPEKPFPDFGDLPVPIPFPGKKQVPGPRPIREPVPDMPLPKPLPEAAIEFDDPIGDLFRRMKSPKTRDIPWARPGALPPKIVLPPLPLGERTRLGERVRQGKPLLGLTSSQLGTSEGVLAWALRQYAKAYSSAAERGVINTSKPRTPKGFGDDFIPTFVKALIVAGATAIGGATLKGVAGGGLAQNWTEIINSMTGRRSIVMPKGPNDSGRRPRRNEPTGPEADPERFQSSSM